MADDNILTQAIKSGQAYVNPYTQRTVSSDLDKNAFLRLLTTQLQYQDPLSPMENTEFIAQMAQFTSLEQMQNLNTTMSNSQAFNLVGKNVYAVSYNSETGDSLEYNGVVDSVYTRDGKAYCRIGESDVPYDDVVEVYSTSASVKDENTSNISKNMVVDQALGLIGKCVQAFTLDEEGNVTGFTEGKVGYVKFDGETPVLNINGTDVNTYEVISVSDDMMLKGKTIGYDNGEETLYGEVKDVEVSGDNVYLNIDGESVQIVDISSMMNALSLIGEDVSYGGISGTVESIVIRNALPYLMTANGEINYKDVNK